MAAFLIILLEFILSKRIHIGVLAYLNVIYFLRCLGVELTNLLLPIISALLVWSAYLENLTTDIKEDGINIADAPHGILPRIESSFFKIENSFFIFYILAIALAYIVNVKAFFLSILCVLIFSSYVQRFIPHHDKGFIRLKELFLIKNIIPPLGWIMACLIVPLSALDVSLSLEHWIFIFIFFLFSFREEIKFDIPDTKGDLLAGIKTIPNTLGEDATKLVLQVINFSLLTSLYLLIYSLWADGNIFTFESILKNMFPLLMAFAFGHEFEQCLFRERKKEYCNIGIIWWIGTVTLFILVPFPFNIAVFVLIRLAGNFFGKNAVHFIAEEAQKTF